MTPDCGALPRYQLRYQLRYRNTFGNGNTLARGYGDERYRVTVTPPLFRGWVRNVTRNAEPRRQQRAPR